VKISPTGLAMIKDFEGLRLTAYTDPAGVTTIGWGHTKTAPAFKTITKAQAEILFEDDIEEAETDLNRSLDAAGLVVNQSQFDALMSWVFNLGITKFRGSTAYRLMREGAPDDEVAAALSWWNKATDPKTGKKVSLPGLARRRKAEHDLYLGYAADKPKPLAQTKTVIGGALAVGAGAIALVDQLAEMTPVLTEMTTTLKPYATAGSWVAVVCTALSIAGGMLSIYGRWKLRREALERPEGSV
jgi:lysozyme